MKNKRTPFLVLLFFLAGVFTAAAQEADMVLDHADAFSSKQRPGAVFPHERHTGNLECFDCHHSYEDGENVLAEQDLEEGNTDLDCTSCHDATTDIDLKNAFHRQCIGCHRLLRIAREAGGPELCGECHIRH